MEHIIEAQKLTINIRGKLVDMSNMKTLIIKVTGTHPYHAGKFTLVDMNGDRTVLTQRPIVVLDEIGCIISMENGGHDTGFILDATA